ncbi:tetratricopeptide repeat protein [Acidobacteria bacterium AH-259-G07]|nr:tetratricopeptide repeat protein [Acidobacteria bacterium AH-259-G07]
MKPGVRSARHLLISFLAVTLVLAITLGWLGWRLLEQDLALGSKRIQERLDTGADLIAAALLRRLSETEEQFTVLSTLPESEIARAVSQQAEQLPEDALIAIVRPQSLDAYPSSHLLYYPLVPVTGEPPESVFAAVEAFEFEQKEYARAIALLRELARSEEAGIRAGALLRLARNLQKTSQYDRALATYSELSQLGSTSVGGLPAELLARYARCNLLDKLNQVFDLQQEAKRLYSDLRRSPWRIDRASYRFYSQEVAGWLNSNGDLPINEPISQQDALALAAGVESIWQEWQRIGRGEGTANGYRNLWINESPLFLLWRSTPTRLVALVAGELYLKPNSSGWTP